MPASVIRRALPGSPSPISLPKRPGGTISSFSHSTSWAGTEMVSRFSRPGAGRIDVSDAKYAGQCVMSSKMLWKSGRLSASVSPHSMRAVANFANGSPAARRPSSRENASHGSMAANFTTISAFSGEYLVQPPAGAIAVTLRARPRSARPRAIQPPSELPTRCAVSQPF
ncbi:Uncharacterised protein [Mycobacteroides abscessus subsp. abscessus]|nr:Uncharacterised protein [Mycobacteroides abscessus subsp. abscessus]